MADMKMTVNTALSEVPVNLLPLLDDTDFKTRETAVAYNASGMDLVWNFVTVAGAYTQTAVTPTTSGTYDWAHQGDGMYSIEVPASGGASINNDTVGYGWFSGVVTGVLPWRGPVIEFTAAADESDVLQVIPLIPPAIDLASTATWRIALMLVNGLDDLPSTGEITPGTIAIDRKAYGGTSWSNIRSDVACSESAGQIYYDETFSAANGYFAGDFLRFTFKAQKVVVNGNDHEISDSTGRMFYSGIAGTASSAGIATQASVDTTRFIKNTGSQKIPFVLVDSTDHVTRKTGITVTKTRSIDGAAYASSTGTVTEVGGGLYYLTASAADMNGDDIVFKFTGTACDPVEIHIPTAS